MLKKKFNTCFELSSYTHDITGTTKVEVALLSVVVTGSSEYIISHLAMNLLDREFFSSVLYETLAGNFMGVTQYDESSDGLDLETACKILLDKNSGLTAFDRYANLSSMFLNVS